MNQDQDTIASREQKLCQLANEYHNGSPSVSDNVYDTMLIAHRRARMAAPNHPQWADTILDRVGAPVNPTSGFSKRIHLHPMLSLDNVYVAPDDTCADLDKWYTGWPPGSQNTVVAEPKIDGCALSVVYLGSLLARAVTRGDGTEGDDVTDNAVASAMAPLSLIDTTVPWGVSHRSMSIGEYFEVRGEVVMSFAQFEKLNAELIAAGEEPYANPRNACAGALRLRDPEECARRGLEFIAHGVIGDAMSTCHSDSITLLHTLGFRTVNPYKITGGIPPIPVLRRIVIEPGGQPLPYPTDGMVFKVDNYETRKMLGFTSRAPRWGVALKFQQDIAVTRLRGITVQVGRSGVLTPVAELDPVTVDGSVISRATLHNEDQVRRLGLQVGDDVEVRKAAGIIPEVVRSVTWDNRKAELAAFASAKYPEDDELAHGVTVNYMVAEDRSQFDLITHIRGVCPDCGAPVVREIDTPFGKLTEDPHAITASKIFGVPIAEVTDEQRRYGKTDNHGAQYGLQVEIVPAGGLVDGSVLSAEEALAAARETIAQLATTETGSTLRNMSRAARQIGKTETTTEVLRKRTVAIRCTNPNCTAQLAARIEHFCSRKCLNIEGIGEEASLAIAKYMKLLSSSEGTLPTPLLLCDLRAAELARLQWITASGGTMTFGNTRAAKAVASISAADSLPLHRWLFAMGIPSVGENTSKEISRLFRDMVEVVDACRNEDGIIRVLAAQGSAAAALKSEFSVSHHLGPVSAARMVSWVRDNDELVSRLCFWNRPKSNNYYPKPVFKEPPFTGSQFTGKRVCLTGALSVTRGEFSALLEQAGAIVVGSVSKTTHFLISGDKSGSKLDKARAAGVTVLDEAEARAML